MQKSTVHEIYGEVCYYENIWTGKKKITINGVELAPKNKTTFLFNDGTGVKEAKISGSVFNGVKLNIDGNIIEMTPPTKWYEYITGISLVLFVIVWGNNPALVAILPIVGGGIGGAISGLLGYFTVLAVKSADKWYLKAAIWLGMFAANIVACFLVAMVFIFSMA